MARSIFRRVVNALPRHSIIGRLVRPLVEDRKTLAGRMSWIGIAIVVVFLMVALFADVLAPFDPLALADQKDIPPWTNAPVSRNESFNIQQGNWTESWFAIDPQRPQLPPAARAVDGNGATSNHTGDVQEVWDFFLNIKRDAVQSVGFIVWLAPDTSPGHYARVRVSSDGGGNWSVPFDIRDVSIGVHVDVTNLTAWNAAKLGDRGLRFQVEHAADGPTSGNLSVDYFGATTVWLTYWHLMGTDGLGRDVFSRVLLGTRTSLVIMAIGVTFALVVGFPIGLYSGYRGGTFDKIMVLFMDSLYSFPGLLFAGLIAVLIGKGVVNIGLAVTVIYIPLYFRVTRSQMLSAREELYVEAARASGAPPTRIVFRYIMMNVIVAIPVIFSISAADAILTAAGLSYLGLGVEPPTADWGLDLSAAAEKIDNGIWWSSFFPGFAIVFLTVGLSFLGEGLNDIVNPLLKKERS